MIRLKSLCINIILVLFLLCSTAVSQSIVETLPGYPGPLPFKLETGYIGVDEDENVQLFYYFIESEGDPMKDPLALWITGGPGCSGFSALVYEIGPLNYDLEAIPDGGLPSFVLNTYSWTKVASIIFIDSPEGTGFSYSNASEGYHSSDTKTAERLYVFLRQWLLKHPDFIKNRLYILGDSYGGLWTPMLVRKISEGNEAGVKPHMALEGYTLGNPITDSYIDENSKVVYAHRHGLLSDEYYEMAKINCNGNYVNPNPSNALCHYALQQFNQCTSPLYAFHILEAKCESSSLRQEELGFAQRSLEEESKRIRLPSKQENLWCRGKTYSLCGIWANDPSVGAALHIRKGTVKQWKRCAAGDIDFDKNVRSVIGYHQLLKKKGYRVLVYSGDQDFAVPYTGTVQWIRQLNLTIDDDWRPWFVEGEVAGYTERYINPKSQYSLTFATVKGAGHTAAEYNPRQSLAMFERFLSYSPL